MTCHLASLTEPGFTRRRRGSMATFGFADDDREVTKWLITMGRNHLIDRGNGILLEMMLSRNRVSKTISRSVSGLTGEAQADGFRHDIPSAPRGSFCRSAAALPTGFLDG